MNSIAAIAGDLKSLTVAVVQAARDADWDAVTRYEAVRHSLVEQLSSIAADGIVRPQVVDALRDAEQWGLEIGAAITEARDVQDKAADHAMKSDKAGRAYAKARGV